MPQHNRKFRTVLFSEVAASDNQNVPPSNSVRSLPIGSVSSPAFASTPVTLEPIIAKELGAKAESDQCKLSFLSGCAVCRICHGGEMSSPACQEGYRGEPLISPCHCRGTMGLYHRSCLERWLSSSNTTQCEICKFAYKIERRPKPVTEFLRRPGSSTIRRHLIGDFLCYFLLTPLAVVSSWLCISGAVHYARAQKDSPELPGLICLASFLIMTYIVWITVSLRYHYMVYKNWCKRNANIRIIVDNNPQDTGNSPQQQAVLTSPTIVITPADNNVVEAATSSANVPQNDVNNNDNHWSSSHPLWTYYLRSSSPEILYSTGFNEVTL